MVTHTTPWLCLGNAVRRGAPGTAVVQAFPKRPLPFLFYHQCGLGSWSWTGKSQAGLVVGEYMKLTPSPPPYLKIQYHQHHNTKQSTSAASSLFEQVSAERAPFPCTCRPPLVTCTNSFLRYPPKPNSSPFLSHFVDTHSNAFLHHHRTTPNCPPELLHPRRPRRCRQYLPSARHNPCLGCAYIDERHCHYHW